MFRCKLFRLELLRLINVSLGEDRIADISNEKVNNSDQDSLLFFKLKSDWEELENWDTTK